VNPAHKNREQKERTTRVCLDSRNPSEVRK